ncbi:primosomal replication protein N [Gilliamella sp. B2776]|nr:MULTISPECIES: primosomal replication protein N [unclassified Gilliamella]MCX8649083.1 primosomal replication protein N [Gilliamella sp. B2779]MCX8653041.1 primosomal replication protein N [Gilliamella sp. B2737]MCX8655301.1 primosomal replication protein N [Gilliamella sp. B2894]MCX8690895.1 primosomal replication protein N [Gilliamella sp. B2776]MCX8694383.1 primosomal replication protein N [Gilliamella sp. B2881]
MILTNNRLVLSGIVKKTPMRKVSPSGISHCQFYLEHVSKQIEAELTRQAWCIVPVIVSGQQELSYIKKGSKVLVSGFISTHTKRNKTSQLVLHADQVKLLGE